MSTRARCPFGRNCENRKVLGRLAVPVASRDRLTAGSAPLRPLAIAAGLIARLVS